jgi:phosphatidylglycerophosphate synthase
MKQESKKIKFKDSLKSWDTENFLDRVFYRPIGFRIALLLKATPITPNIVTVISIFVGMFACMLFYPHNNLIINLVGFALLVFANILDCVDGQLARITGIKSEIGRILDGFCGDLWFATFYTVMALRMVHSGDWGWPIVFVVLISGFSHFIQASMVDLYKTFHIHMLNRGINSEFETAYSIKRRYKSVKWGNSPIAKSLMRLYYLYTVVQELKTPYLKKYNQSLTLKHPDGFPQETIELFRGKSLKLMPLLNAFTFNTRSIVILVSLLLNLEWIYFIVEILILNPLLAIAIYKHEKMCKELSNNV